jgi:hypothetical protein
MLCHVAVVRTDVLEECITIIRLTRISELEMSALTSNQSTLLAVVFLCSVLRLLVAANILSLPVLVTLMSGAISSSKSSVFTRATWCIIPEDGIFQIVLYFSGFCTCGDTDTN